MAIINSSIRKVVQESSGGGSGGNDLFTKFISQYANGPGEVDIDEAFFDGTRIVQYQFYNCKSIRNVKVGTVIDVGQQAFTGSSIKKFEIEATTNAALGINGGCFGGCASLEEVIWGNVQIYSWLSMFSGCTSLASLTITKSSLLPLSSNSNAFKDCPAGFKVKVPANLVDAYKAATNWVIYADHIEAIE